MHMVGEGKMSKVSRSSSKLKLGTRRRFRRSSGSEKDNSNIITRGSSNNNNSIDGLLLGDRDDNDNNADNDVGHDGDDNSQIIKSDRDADAVTNNTVRRPPHTPDDAAAFSSPSPLSSCKVARGGQSRTNLEGPHHEKFNNGNKTGASSLSSTSSTTTMMEQLTLHLSILESKRDAKRQQLDTLFEELQRVRKKMSDIQSELLTLDDDIEEVQQKIRHCNSGAAAAAAGGKDTYKEVGSHLFSLSKREQHQNGVSVPSNVNHVGEKTHYMNNEGGGDEKKEDYVFQVIEERATIPPATTTITTPTTNNNDEILTDPLTSRTPMTMNPDEHLTEPMGTIDNEENDIEDFHNDEVHFRNRPTTRGGDGIVGAEDIPDEEADHHAVSSVVPQAPLLLRKTSSVTGVGQLQIQRGNSYIGRRNTDNSHSSSKGSSGGGADGNGSVSASSSSMTMHRAPLPAGLIPSIPADRRTSSSFSSSGGPNANSTLDQYFYRPSSGHNTSASSSHVIGLHEGAQRKGSEKHQNTSTLPPCSFSSSSSSSTSQQQQHLRSTVTTRPTRDERNMTYMNHLASDNFPWSEQTMHYLRNVFYIQNFRDHQKEIINCTMSGDDAFVIMRTGGGKSLTYQLPALLECHHHHSYSYSSPTRKITLVISPLLSLIHDQVEQMNEIMPGSAVCFTSGMKGGNAEHAKRWARVRDVNGGVALVYVTPEKVHKSNKLRNELEKLHEQKRLGRFVIDEAHCACHWGHDFRPDYTKLGMLKTHFPTVPLLAVTATASNRVRDDCCQILRLGKNYQFFRSSANRPNLTYAIREKLDGKDRVVDEMASFIKEKHPRHAGIIYTFSRNDADEVADKLCDRGIVARSYHSSISETAKEQIHKSWMRNDTQVIVATIAFGLGINKPDVRFVLHHSLSKSLEAYYQESGRAGRNGEPADCVLYYSAKDVPRMLCMIHGENGEGSFWSMVRYAQASGDDTFCRGVILSILGEPGSVDMNEMLRRKCEGTEDRDVASHAKTVVELVRHEWRQGNEVTLAQLVTKWRSNKDQPECVAQNPPGKDLTKDECERVVIALMLSDVFKPKITFTPYGSCMYIQLGPRATSILSSQNSMVITVRFPLRRAKSTPRKARSAVTNETGWISTKKNGGSRIGAGNKKGTTPKTNRVALNSRRRSAAVGKRTPLRTKPNDKDSNDSVVIELDSSSSNDERETAKTNSSRKRKRLEGKGKTAALKKMKRNELDLFDDSPGESSDECEFD